MEELLKKYITKYLNAWEDVEIISYNVEGVTCSVDYETYGCKENLNINIWDMVVFLNQA